MITPEELFETISKDYKRGRKRPDLPEFCELKLTRKPDIVYFTIGWHDIFEVQFNPKTIKIKYTKINKVTKEKKAKTKQVPLETNNLVELALELYEA